MQRECPRKGAALTPRFSGHIFPILLVFSGQYLFDKICERLLVGESSTLRDLLALTSGRVRARRLLVWSSLAVHGLPGACRWRACLRRHEALPGHASKTSLESMTNPQGVRERSGITRPFLSILYERPRASLTLVAASRALGWGYWSAPRRGDRVGAMGQHRRTGIREAPWPWLQMQRIA